MFKFLKNIFSKKPKDSIKILITLDDELFDIKYIYKSSIENTEALSIFLYGINNGLYINKFIDSLKDNKDYNKLLNNWNNLLSLQNYHEPIIKPLNTFNHKNINAK